MVKYICDPCKYVTDKTSNIDKHVTTKKHIATIKRSKKKFICYRTQYTNDVQFMTETETHKYAHKYKCMNSGCCKSFISKHNLERHMNEKCEYCDDAETISDPKFGLMMATIKQLSDKIDNLEKNSDKTSNQLNEKLDITNQVINETKVSMNETKYASLAAAKGTQTMLKFVTKSFANAPPIRLLKDNELDDMLLNTDDYCPSNASFETKMIYYFKKDKLHEFIGTKLISEYRKDEPGEQSFWTADQSRQNFVIRHSVSDDVEEWTDDKHALKLLTFVVNPAMNRLRNIIIQYDDILEDQNNDYNSGKSCITQNENKIILNHRDILMEIKDEIDLKNLHGEVVKYIAPFFTISFDKKEIITSKLPADVNDLKLVKTNENNGINISTTNNNISKNNTISDKSSKSIKSTTKLTDTDPSIKELKEHAKELKKILYTCDDDDKDTISLDSEERSRDEYNRSSTLSRYDMRGKLSEYLSSGDEILSDNTEYEVISENKSKPKTRSKNKPNIKSNSK